MPLQRLSWRVGLPFVLLVLAETATLVVYLTMQIGAEQRSRLEKQAATDAAFFAQSGWQASERMATDLQKVTGFQVFFRHGEALTPEPETEKERSALLGIAADGTAHRVGDLEYVASSIGDERALLLVRRLGNELRDPRVLQVLVAFWLLAMLIAWLVGRSLVRPLRHLAAQLPGIESPGPLELPEATRRDEIGDLARAFLRTRTALHDERQQRARAEKLAVLGRMTTALAHEVQNPVAAIKMHAQLLRGGPADETAGIVEQEVARIENLLNQWLFLGRPEPPVVREADIAALLRETLDALRAQLQHSHTHIDLRANGPLRLQCDQRRLGQVFRNLVTNAAQAMPSGGTLRITAEIADHRCRITFEDEGRGFSADALAHFAEFFYSEKEGGMGIGLSVANEITKAHGGSLHATNRPHGGACVTVELPCSPESAPAP
jgi:signal transduction histidine kinase